MKLVIILIYIKKPIMVYVDLLEKTLKNSRAQKKRDL